MAKRSFGIILDPDFDLDTQEPANVERMVFGDRDGDCKFDETAIGRTRSAHRKKRTVSTDDPEMITVPDEPPPGWADS